MAEPGSCQLRDKIENCASSSRLASPEEDNVVCKAAISFTRDIQMTNKRREAATLHSALPKGGPFNWDGFSRGTMAILQFQSSAI